MRASGFRSVVCSLLFLLSFGAARAAAQFDRAAVVGTVHDSSGAVVPDAKVTLTNTATGVSLDAHHRPARAPTNSSPSASASTS